MTTAATASISEVASRLREIANSTAEPEVMISTDDLRQLLDAASNTGVPGAGMECEEAFYNHFNYDPESANFDRSDLAVWRDAWASSRRGTDGNAVHHVHQLGQALGECIAAAGIIRPDVYLSGPELLMFAEDLRTVLAQSEQGAAASNAVIDFVLANPCESPMEFLRCWNQGDFESLRKEWPETPEEVFIGADTLHPKTVGYGKGAPKPFKPLTAIKLLTNCRASLASGLESVGSCEAEFSIHDRALIADVDAFLLGHPSPVDAAGAASAVRDDLNADGAYAQYKAAAQAVVRAVERAYPINSVQRVKVGRSIIDGEVVQHMDCWWSRPGEFIIRNIKTDKTRSVTHTQVKDAVGQ